MFSSSALRFSKELKNVDRDNIRVISSRGPNGYNTYSIHQIEMLVALLGPDVKRVMAIGNNSAPAMVVEFAGGRFGTFGHFGGSCPFTLAISYDNGTNAVFPNCSDFFPNFVHELVDFFRTGEIKAPERETIAVIGIREKGFEALNNPGVWIDCDF